MKTIKILQATVGNAKDGVTKYICQNYMYIDKKFFKMDFITFDDDIDFKKDFEKLGAKFYKKPGMFNIIKYLFFMKKLQKDKQYDIIHFNLSYANFIPVLIAKLVGIKRIIIHSHSTQIDEKNSLIRRLKYIIHFIGKQIIRYMATDFLACSQLAAKWMYPEYVLDNKNYKIINNAINVHELIFDYKIRQRMRTNLKIDNDTLCIGHVGRFSYQKNQEFLLEIFNEIQKREKALLILIGSTTSDEFYFKNLINTKIFSDLKDKVEILGIRNDVKNIMQAMDCFVLSSRFEGLPIVGIEAQALSLPCYFSDTITKEVKITNLVKFISLNKSPEYWAKEIIKCKNIERKDMSKEIIEAGYDINTEIKKIETFYKQKK